MLVGDFDLSKWFYFKASDSSVSRVMFCYNSCFLSARGVFEIE